MIKLTARQEEAYFLRYCMKHTYQVIGEMMSINRSAARQYVRVAEMKKKGVYSKKMIHKGNL